MSAPRQSQPETDPGRAARGTSAPALLAVLCMLATLPPAAYAAMPQLAVRHAAADPASAQSEQRRELAQIRALSRACVLGLRTLLERPEPVSIDPVPALDLEPPPPALASIRAPHSRRPRSLLREPEHDLPPPTS